MNKKTKNSDTESRDKGHETFKDKNQLFAVWIPSRFYVWLQTYLKKYCYGDKLSDRFKVLLFSLQEQEASDACMQAKD